MFCGKCGTQCSDNAAFCPGCGAAVGAQPQAQPQPQPQAQDLQPVQQAQPQQYDQAQYNQYNYQPAAGYGYQPQNAGSAANAKKRNTLIGIAAVALVAIAALVVVLLLVFGGNSPENVVEDHIEAAIDGDYDDMLDTLPEDILKKLAFKEGDTEAEYSQELREMLMASSTNYKTVNFEISHTEDVPFNDSVSLRNRYAELGYIVESVKKVHITMSALGFSETDDIKVVEIDGDWYVDYDEVF